MDSDLGGDESSDESEAEGLGIAASLGGGGGARRPKKSKVRAALDEEGDLSHLIFNRRAGRKRKSKSVLVSTDGSGRHKEVLECTACRNPLYDNVDVHRHPTLGVAVCYYCCKNSTTADNDAPTDGAPTDGAPTDAPTDGASAEDKCMWCMGDFLVPRFLSVRQFTVMK